MICAFVLGIWVSSGELLAVITRSSAVWKFACVRRAPLLPSDGMAGQLGRLMLVYVNVTQKALKGGCMCPLKVCIKMNFYKKLEETEVSNMRCVR